MRNDKKVRLLFLRFTRPDLPAFIRLHLQEQVKCLSHHFDVTVIDHPCDYRQLCDEYAPDLAIFESGVYVGKREVKNVFANPEIPKLGFIHCDAYCPTREYAISDMAAWGITTFFTISVSMAAYTPAIADHLFVWPNFVNPDLYHDYTVPKVIPVLFTGSQAIHYPWRNRINKIISQHYPSLQSPHFGWNEESVTARMLFGEQYARLISASCIAPTCGTIAEDVVRKHFEIPACNTCLVTQRTPAIEAAGFSDLANCVFAEDVDVVEKLDWLFQRPEELERITVAGRKLVESRHAMLNRDQIFQWYTLQKQLKPGKKIVQLGPFLPLTIVDQSSRIGNGNIMSGGIDRLLLKQGDEKLWSGNYDEAEKLYRRSLNYHEMPEPILRLAMCYLYRGNPIGAVDILSKQVQSVLEEGSEPDAVEWAYFIVALLCRGQLRDAVARANQFSSLRHEELDRVRAAVRVLSNEMVAITAERYNAGYRPSVHQLPSQTIDQWRESLRKMLIACRQTKAAAMLTRSAVILTSSEAAVRTSRDNLNSPFFELSNGVEGRGDNIKVAVQHEIGSVKIVDYKTRMRKWLRRHIKVRALRMLWTIESRAGYFLPYKWSSMSYAENALTVQTLLSSEFIRAGLLIGAASRVWLTEAFLAGMGENRNLPSIVCMNSSTPQFIELRKRLAMKTQVQFRDISEDSNLSEVKKGLIDVVAIDCSELGRSFERQKIPDAALIILDDITMKSGYDLFRALLADQHFILSVHEPSCFGGYAIFRKVINPNGAVPHGDGSVALERMDGPVVLACDEVYAMPLATTLRSITETNRSCWPLDFYVLSDGFSEAMRMKVLSSLPTGSASVRWVAVDLRLFGEFATLPHVSKMTYARLLIPYVFPDNVSRVLYLDADLLVLDDLGPLWETDLEGAAVGAVLDRWNLQFKQNEPGLEDVPRVRDYFNAGVLLIDLDRWREQRISEKALNYLSRHPRTPFSDQDALNVVCDGFWKKLNPRWNFQDHYETSLSDMRAEQKPSIVHFVMREKPWVATFPNLNTCFYDAFRSRTCFARTPLEKLQDILQGCWFRLKGILRRYMFLRVIWRNVIRPSR